VRRWLLVLLLIAGCDPTEADCRRLVDQLNGSADRLASESLPDGGTPDELVAPMRRLGTKLQHEADVLAALPLEAALLVGQRDAHVDATRRAAAAATMWATALEDMMEARAAGDAAREAMDANLTVLQERCEASTCYELMQRLARPSGHAPADMPEELARLARDLSTITTEVDAVDEAIAEHAKQARALAEALGAMRAAEKTTARARRSFEKAAADQSQAVDRINGVCRP